MEEIQYLCQVKRRFFMKAKHIKDYYVLFMYMLYETYSATSICTGKQLNISNASAQQKKVKIAIS